MSEIEMNERLITSIARLYENRGLTHEELIEAGRKGINKAKEHYKEGSRFSFSAYAVWWIRHDILQAINEKDNL